MRKFFYIVGFPLRLFFVSVIFPLLCLMEPNDIEEHKREMGKILRGEGV